MLCHAGIVVDGLELLLSCRNAGAVQADVLLLDLRQFEDGGCNVLKKIGKELHLRRIPLVILANSAADSQISKDSDRHNLWRLSRPVDSEQCVTPLRSLLDLQMAILKLPRQRESKRSAEKLIGRPSLERSNE
jgi:CheY-like chemotaxis protein